MYETQPLPHYFNEEHEALRRSVRAFVVKEIEPHVAQWETDGRVPLSAHRLAGALGFLGIGYPEEVGGSGGDLFMQIVFIEEMARTGAGGVCAALGAHGIALPPILASKNVAMIDRVVRPTLSGDTIAALAITEPGGGSDVAALRTRAVLSDDGGHFIVSGEKTYITSGLRADFLTVAVRTDPVSVGANGISLLLIDGDTPGLTRNELHKMGWWASDTASLHFNECRVPVSHLIGQLHHGFKRVMHNFNSERLTMAVQAVGFAQACLDEALTWSRQRKTFGKALVEHQAARHKLIDMAMRIDAARSLVYDIAYRTQHRIDEANVLVARTSWAKNFCTQTMQFCADQAVQLLGGMGFMRGSKSERVYREAKVMMIGGGAEDIMKDLAASQLRVG